MEGTSAGPRPRQQRAIANDGRILDAAVSVLAHHGWEDTSVLAVAERAGLSRRAVLNRYGDRVGVTRAVWESRLAPPLVDAIRGLVRAIDSQPISPMALLGGLAPFLDPDTEMRAASEILVVSCYQPELREIVGATLDDALKDLLTPGEVARTAAEAARRAFVLSLAFGVLLESRCYPDGLDIDLHRDVETLASVLTCRMSPGSLPPAKARHLDGLPVLDVDATVDALLSATLRLVGELGYEGATIDRITRECGHSSGLLFGRYDNKRALFLDATDRMLTSAHAANLAFQSEIAQATSPGVADAVMTREFMDPTRRGMRTITLEQYRLSWHDTDVLETFTAARQAALDRATAELIGATPGQIRGRVLISFARGIGMGLLANLMPGVAALPHDVVSVPLVDGVPHGT